LATLSDTKTFGSRTVNEFHFSYVRDNNQVGTPQGTVGTSLASQGFVTPTGAPSILPQRPGIVGIENVTFNSFVIGSTVTGLNQIDNTYELRDNFLRVMGAHTLKLGGEVLLSQVNAAADVQSNGTFAFVGSETGVDFADFLIGIPSFYKQGDAQPFYMRNQYGAIFAEDSWRVRPRLTLNYGVRWDVIMPWYEKYNQIQTLVPGEQSVVYPGAPTGLVFPGDPGVARSLAPVRWDDFSPRVGLAWSPRGASGLARTLFGDADRTSIRVGAGRFFTAVEGVSAGVMAGDPPYGSTYISPAPPLFSDPFVTASTGLITSSNASPSIFHRSNASPRNPNSNVNWAPFLPVSGLPGYKPDGVSPYSVQYTISIQRQFGASTVVTAGYIGSESHHLLTLLEANPGDPALCLSLSQVSQVAPGTPTCGPFGESNTFTTAAGSAVQGTRPVFGPNFGSVDWLTTIGNANYNALQLSLRHTTGRLELQAGYTYGKSLDNSSSISEQLNPYDYRATYAPSAFDLKQNFVASYRYELPFGKLGGPSQLAGAWVLSGITRFATGFPVTLTNSSDSSLLGTQPDGVNSYGVDLPQVTSGSLHLNGNPRNGLAYFNTSLFSLPPLGDPGNAARRMFYGPGMANFDIALSKMVRLAEETYLQLRLETFNTFNHAQFFGPASINGEITSAAFGQVVSAAAPRLVQAGVKLSF
jgi:hypothetical protein